MNKTNYRYNNTLNSVNYRYIVQIKKDDLNISFLNGNTRQLQLIQNLLLKTKELNIIKCNVYMNDQIIL